MRIRNLSTIAALLFLSTPACAEVVKESASYTGTSSFYGYDAEIYDGIGYESKTFQGCAGKCGIFNLSISRTYDTDGIPLSPFGLGPDYFAASLSISGGNGPGFSDSVSGFSSGSLTGFAGGFDDSQWYVSPKSWRDTPDGGYIPGYGLVFYHFGIDADLNPGAVPEPSTWAMMLLGFGGLGFLGYRKSRKIDVAAMLAV